MGLRTMVAEAARPILARLPRGQLFLARLLRVNDPTTDWEHHPRRYRVFRDHSIGGYMSVDLADWAEREYYFCGQYFDRGNRLLIKSLLTPGDTYIDIGANIGIFSILASRVVGPAGQVYSFEPNPFTCPKLRAHLTVNRADNSRVFELALSDTTGEATLFSEAAHSGGSSMAAHAPFAQTFTVPLRRGEDVLKDLPLGRTVLIKIDTEGFEQKVIAGLEGLLHRERVVLSVEVTDKWLRDTGGSAQQMFQHMRARGYDAYQLGCRGVLAKVNLTPLREPPELSQFDAVFVRPGVMNRWVDNRR